MLLLTNLSACKSSDSSSGQRGYVWRVLYSPWVLSILLGTVCNLITSMKGVIPNYTIPTISHCDCLVPGNMRTHIPKSQAVASCESWVSSCATMWDWGQQHLSHATATLQLGLGPRQLARHVAMSKTGRGWLFFFCCPFLCDDCQLAKFLCLPDGKWINHGVTSSSYQMPWVVQERWYFGRILCDPLMMVKEITHIWHARQHSWCF